MLEKLKAESILWDPGLDTRIILKCIFKRQDGELDWIDLIPVAGFCDQVLKHPIQREREEFID